jgi:hypothetical protein
LTGLLTENAPWSEVLHLECEVRRGIIAESICTRNHEQLQCKCHVTLACLIESHPLVFQNHVLPFKWQMIRVLLAETYSYWLTLWTWALLEKLLVIQLLKNFPTFYGTLRFITVFTRALHWSLFWASSIQATLSCL